MADLNNKKDRDLGTKFDMKIKPKKQPLHLKMLAWVLSYSAFITQKQTLRKHGMKGVKPPYLLLCNHNAFLDFKVATKAIFPYGANYVVAIDGFIKREQLLRNVGCICKRKFTNDTMLVRHLLYAVRTLKQIVAVYPEARYSLIGTNSPLPESLGKLVKLLDVPVVTLITKGHFVNSPLWNLHPRGNRIEADLKQILTLEEVRTLSAGEIQNILEQSFVYDDYQWQKEAKVRIHYQKRAEGIHKVLYQCPSCKTEHRMNSKDHEIFCEACKKRYAMDEFGVLHAEEGVTEFPHAPDWYEWERSEVQKEIESGLYKIEDDVIVDSLPNALGFIPLGEGHLVHDENGFCLTYEEEGVKKTLLKPISSMIACHIEFDYNDRGDGIDLTTLEDNYYAYFKTLKNVVTKIHFATEELYKRNNKLG